mgnify:CR=1 FL=1
MIIRSFFQKTFFGKLLQTLIIIYLTLFLSSCAVNRPQKPPVSVARALETRTYAKDMSTVLKASINTLQDMNYTIDLLNSDVGLITASRTTEGEKIALDDENNSGEEDSFNTWIIIAGVVVFITAVWALIRIMSGGDDNNDDDSKNNNKNKSNHHHYYSRNNKKDDSPKIYRYKVTINLNELKEDETNMRVSAAGEVEQNGSIIQTGGVHEAEFFQNFFMYMNKGLFLEDINFEKK